MKGFKRLFSTLITVFALGCASTSNTSVVETSDGSFAYSLSGAGEVVIVLESGLGDDMSSWDGLAELLRQHAQVFTYNRAGFANSKSRNKNRSGSTIVEELRGILRAANAAPPYLLVGHWLGGAYMELFARMYPDEVAGLVLVDPNASKYPERCKKQNLGYCDPSSGMPWYAALFYPAAVEGEIKGFSATHTQINAINSFPDIPLAVLSSTNTQGLDEQQIKRQMLNTQLHKELAQLSSLSKFVPCETCRHYMHQDDPALVEESVLWVLERLEKE